MNKYSFKPLPPFKGWALENFPFIEEDFDAITSYQLWCKIVEYVRNMASDINSLGTLTNELNTKFDELVVYIDNYFNNLDIQTEIDNKLDEMAESGQLTDIIAQYLQLAGILVYDTIDNLKNAENLAIGSTAKVFGYNNINDGKCEYYKVRQYTTGDVIDNDNIVELVNFPTLVAEKLIGNISYYEITDKMTQEEIQAIMNLKRRKILNFVSESYTFDSTLRLNANTKLLLNNATLTFDLPIVSEDWVNCHGFFNFNPEDEFLGYAGNGNIEVIGGTIIGGNFSFIHGDNITFKGVKFEDCANNHILEMCAINNLTVEGCTFKGTAPLSASSQNENIQLESATYGSFPHLESDNPTYDETPTRNVAIKNCRFLTPTTEGYVFSNGIGNHSGSTYQIENVLIENCYFDNVVKYSIQLYNFSNCIIRNNFFDKESADLNDYIYDHIILKGISKNISIENNIFKNNLRAIITDTPYTTNENINIIGNKFIGYTLERGWSIIELYNTKDCIIDNNEFRDFNQPAIKLKQDGSSDLSSYITKITNNFFKCATSTTVNRVITVEYGNPTVNDNTITAHSSLSRYGIEFGANVYKPYVTSNNISNMNKYLVNSSVSKENIYNATFETTQVSEISLSNYDSGYTVTQFNTCYFTLGSSNNTQVLELKNFHTSNKLEARTYYLPVATSSGASYVIITINNDGTFNYNSNSTNLAFRKLALINEIR